MDEFLLDPETLYIIDFDNEEPYIRTPDGVGIYAYGDRREAEGDVCDHRRVKHFETWGDFELYRNGVTL